MFEKIRRGVAATVQFVRDAARGYEPAVASQVVAAVFTLAAGLGLAVGDLPAKADAVLAFLAVTAPMVAGVVTRQRVTPLAKTE